MSLAKQILVNHYDEITAHLRHAQELASTLPLTLNLEPQSRKDYLFSHHDIALYIHYPFCVHKCPYCDFASLAQGADVVRDGQYIDLLIKEFELKIPLLNGRKLICVYIGGGTPSLCEPKLWGRLFEKIGPYLADGAEISLEANPGTIDLALLKELRAVGFNRISIGVQSFNDQALKRLGRIHNAEEAISACKNAQKAGFYNYNLDIMHGLPRQDVSLALSDLKTALQMESTHLSWYELTLEEGTVFGDHPPVLPDEDVLYAIEQEGFYLLEQANFEHYEVSGYNLGGNYRCIHNQNYWLYGDYLGIGAAAHQKVSLLEKTSEGDTMRIYRSANSENYLEYMNSCMKAYANLEEGVLSKTLVAQEEIAFEFMLNRLRLFNDQVSSNEYLMRTGMSINTIEKELKKIQAQGLIELENDLSFSLNDQGRLMLNDVISYFL